jgi:hypothetical protein
VAAWYLWSLDAWQQVLPLSDRAYIWLDRCAVLTCEALAVCTLISGSKTLPKSSRPGFWFARAALLLFCWILVASLLFVSFVSWTLFAFHNGFMTRGSLTSTLVDFSSISPFFSFREFITLMMGLAAAAAAATTLLAKAPAVSGSQLRGMAMVLAVGLLILTLSFHQVPNRVMGRDSSEQVKGIVRAQLLPTATLVWAPLLLGRPYSDTSIALPLTPAYGFNAYATRVDRKHPRPNFLVFAVEALRAGEESRVIGSRFVMPTVHRLARDGVNFTRAYASANESAYSMTSVISGLHPLKTAERDSFSGVDYPMMRIHDLLSLAYHTAFVSSSNEKWQNMVTISHSPRLDLFFDANRHKGKTLPPDRIDGGFYDAVAHGHLKTGTLDDATTTQRLLDWLQQTLTDGSGRPFYAMVSYQASHYPYEQGFEIPGVFTPRTFTELESKSFSFVYYPESATERMRNRYWNSLAYIDGQIAATVDFLRQRNALDDTVIIVFGDHGELFRENGEVTHAGRLRDRTLNVPLVLHGVKGLPTGEYTQPVSLLDLAPMVVDLAGLPPYEGFQGTVPPGLRDPTQRTAVTNRPVFATVQNFVQEDSVQVSRWKYIEQSSSAYAYLFDLQTDPLEKQNVARANPDIGKCLRETLQEFRHRQFGYYANATLKASFFPPRHDLARSAACEAAFPP